MLAPSVTVNQGRADYGAVVEGADEACHVVNSLLGDHLAVLTLCASCSLLLVPVTRSATARQSDSQTSGELLVAHPQCRLQRARFAPGPAAVHLH